MKKLLLFMFTGITFLGCKQAGKNLLLEEFKTPYGIPPFDKIKVEDYKPAFEEAIKEYHSNVDKIVSNKEEPTFENTIEALDRSKKLLNKVSQIFMAQTSANGTPEIKKVSKEIMPIISLGSDEVILNGKLFDKIKIVYSKKETLGLNPEKLTLLEDTYNTFSRNGGNLNEEDKKILKDINSKLSKLSISFLENVQNEENEFELLIKDEKDLAGLPDWLIKTGKETANKKGKEGYLYTLHKSSSFPFVTYCDNRELRKKMFLAYTKKGDNDDKNDNKKVLLEVLKLRDQKAKILGYKDFAEFTLSNVMAKNIKNVFELMDKIWEPALKMAKQEAKDLQNLAIKITGDKKFKLESWDWFYYTEKLRQEKYNLNSEELKPYFSLENVTNGVFYVVNKLYGLKFEDITKSVPTFNPEVSTYKVTDKDDKYVGILLMDFHPRETKKNGAWMTSYRKQEIDEKGNFINPIISITCNFTRAIDDKPSLLNLEEVTTYFHEFGHALHGLLSQGTYYSLTGTAVKRDFVELPSQIMENWAVQPEVLKFYAKNYKTGEVISDDLIQKIQKVETFNNGYVFVENLAAVYLDLYLHSTSIDEIKDIREFENKTIKKIGLIDEIVQRYKATYFNHILGGYAVGYYAYKWAEVLDADAFEAFVETGNIFDSNTSDRFKQFILTKGGTEEAMELYRNFRGKDPDPKAMLKRAGFVK